ncbi:biliverdin-producing heme oxygenase [Aureimonas sp. AU4]|uniref:biliverdin-producing heme oxygenase n=1 Tax=Aureimonas sp. AU4 TaxID=1638163 RepID=UPI000785AB11|nr:biliverdin-producing heme oxygenase [Aureimonas sp. AU4]
MTHTLTLPGADPAGADAPGETLRDRLRADTREAHEALDARFSPMMAGDAGRYALFLLMNRDAHAAIEPLLSASPLAGEWRATGRLEAARQDCRILGLPAERAVPAPPELDAGTRAGALGLAYVLEGSRLGAKYLLRALARAPARNPFPTHYLEASSDAGPFTGLMRAMARESFSPAELSRSTEVARHTFRFFGRLADEHETAGPLGS